jgi:hypothetical protein
MARLAGFPEETFAAMERIRETALVRFDSLFSPERTLWSLQNLRRFHAQFVEQFDVGEGTFLEKWRKQLAQADDDSPSTGGGTPVCPAVLHEPHWARKEASTTESVSRRVLRPRLS